MPGEPASIETARLLLRPWRESDHAPFAALNADPRVMEWFPAPLTRRESDAMAGFVGERLLEQGWGLWAVEVPGVADFIGFIGLNPAESVLGYPAIEIGWRLAAGHWGHGYAPEGATASLAYGFDTLGLAEIVSMTSVGNAKSRRVMEKIGMARNPADDFDNPMIEPDSPLLRHVLYRVTREQFERAGATV